MNYVYQIHIRGMAHSYSNLTIRMGDLIGEREDPCSTCNALVSEGFPLCDAHASLAGSLAWGGCLRGDLAIGCSYYWETGGRSRSTITGDPLLKNIRQGARWRARGCDQTEDEVLG